MKRKPFSSWIAAAVAMIAGSSAADVRLAAHETEASRRLEVPTDTTTAPARCKMFLQIPSDAQSEVLPWQQRLSFAACREEVALAPASTPHQLKVLVATIDLAMAPSIAIYRDAMARGANDEIKILAAYGLGMTYVDNVVRARNALLVPAGYGGETYGGTTMSRESVLRLMLEALLVPERMNALSAFDQVVKLAAKNPRAAAADPVVAFAVADARAQTALLR